LYQHNRCSSNRVSQQRVLERDIVIFAGLCMICNNVWCLQCSLTHYTDGTFVVVQSTKTVKSVYIAEFENAINLLDTKNTNTSSVSRG